MSLCRSVGLSVRRSVCWWVGRSLSDLLHWHFRRYASGFCITAPAQPQATAAVLYMAPPLPLPSTLLPLPNIRDYASLCIRQCMSETAGSLVGLLDGPSVVLYPVCFFNILRAFLHHCSCPATCD